MGPKGKAKQGRAPKAQHQKVIAVKNEQKVAAERIAGAMAERNAKYNADLMKAWQTINNHVDFAGFEKQIGGEGSNQFDAQQCQDDLAKTGFYRYEGNPFICTVETQTDLPQSRGSVDNWASTWYGKFTERVAAGVDEFYSLRPSLGRSIA